jgi:hypothetical protein
LTPIREDSPIFLKNLLNVPLLELLDLLLRMELLEPQKERLKFFQGLPEEPLAE